MHSSYTLDSLVHMGWKAIGHADNCSIPCSFKAKACTRKTSIENLGKSFGKMILARAIRRPFSGLAAFTKEVSSLHAEYIAKSLDAYKKNKLDVDKELDKLFSSNRIVLFSDGTVDAPKSELSLNVIRMLTEAQCIPLAHVNVLEHPAILGYTIHKSGSHSTPHLYVGGTFYGDHDRVLQKYKTGDLFSLGTAKKGDKLPIGLY